MNGEALSLAEQAIRLDPRFLPASDAVIVLSVISVQGEAALAELERIMALDPNRHSLVLTASNLTPTWGGSVELMLALCADFAGQVADVPDYTPDLCLAQSILRGRVWGESCANAWLRARHRPTVMPTWMRSIFAPLSARSASCAICAEHEHGVDACLLDSVWSAPSESGLKHTL